MDYFFIVGMAELFVQMMKGADALAEGEPKGIMAPVPRQQHVLLPGEVPGDLHQGAWGPR